MRFLAALSLALCATFTGCVSTSDELSGLAARPRLDRAVLVSGGAFFAPAAVGQGTFDVEGAAGGEAIVDLSVTAHHNLWTPFCVLLGFGVLPAYSDVTVMGQIVRRR